jgi:hypothetical protein
MGAADGSTGDLASILLTQSLSVIDAILEDAGIISIVGVERPEEEEEEEEEVEEVELDNDDDGEYAATHLDEVIEELAISAPFRDQSQLLSPNERLDNPPSVELLSVSLQRASHSTPITSTHGAPNSEHTQRNLYKRFLVNVVNEAKTWSGVPHRGFAKLASLPSSGLTADEVESAVADSWREFKIGAAGELCVNYHFMTIIMGAKCYRSLNG